MGGRAVPWISWAEWWQVKEWLTSQDTSQQWRGIDRVSAWRARGRLPLAVDITAALVEVMQQDGGLHAGPDGAPRIAFPPTPGGSCTAATGSQCTLQAGSSDQSLRLQYSITLVRMVNGLTDSLQKGKVAVSVAGLAQSAGLPRCLVDIRHEATHNELPSLPVLRVGAWQALAWLAVQYWEHQASHLAACHARICELLAGIHGSWQAAARKALGQQDMLPLVPDEEEGPEAGSDAGAAYQGAAGQQHRRQLLSELRSLVPPSHTALLVPAVLQSAELVPNAPADKAQRASAGSRQDGSGGGGANAPERAANAALQSLLRQYPRLQPLLLHSIVQQLCEGPAAHWNAPSSSVNSAMQSPSQQAPPPADGATLLAWLALLLGEEQGDRPTPGAASKKRRRSQAPPQAAAAAAPAAGLQQGQPPLGADQLRELLAMLLRAQAAAAATAQIGGADVAGGVGNAAGSCSDTGKGDLSQARPQAARLLSAALAAAGGGGGVRAAALLPELLRLAAPGATAATGTASASASGNGAAAHEAALEAAVLEQRALMEQCASTRAQQQHAAPAAAAPGGVRWRRAASWRACAIGCLPSVHDPSGRLPCLQAPGQLAQQQQQQQQPHSVGADAGMLAEETAAAMAAGAAATATEAAAQPEQPPLSTSAGPPADPPPAARTASDDGAAGAACGGGDGGSVGSGAGDGVEDESEGLWRMGQWALRGEDVARLSVQVL